MVDYYACGGHIAHDDVIKWKHFFRVVGHLCGEFIGHRWIPAQSPVTWNFDIFFALCLNKPLGKQSWGWWYETPPRSLWRHCNDMLHASDILQPLSLRVVWRQNEDNNAIKTKVLTVTDVIYELSRLKTPATDNKENHYWYVIMGAVASQLNSTQLKKVYWS